MKNAEHCDSCGHSYPHSELVKFDDQQLCTDCLESATLICTHCGKRIWKDENAGDSTTPLCQNCYDWYYVSCSRCGRIIRENSAAYRDDDEEEPLCHECYDHSCCEGKIHDYYYKPDPIFHGDGPRYFGVELEIDGAGESNHNAGELLRIANAREELFYCKHDGSLEDGFEIVTHPLTLDCHQNTMPWGDVMKKAVEMGYTSHQANTCGLHVHVSRVAFGATEAAQDSCIARILYFVEKYWEELLKFSRRTPRQLERWADRYGYKDQPKEILDHAKKGGHGGRYTCVNLENTSTIEIRVFRGTLKLNTLIATLQLVDRICDVALYMSDDEIRAMSWSAFVSGCQAPELVQYLKERRLYVNEPVESEEEV